MNHRWRLHNALTKLDRIVPILHKLDRKYRVFQKKSSTPCCQSLRSNSLIVSEYEVPKVWFLKSVYFFLNTLYKNQGKWFGRYFCYLYYAVPCCRHRVGQQEAVLDDGPHPGYQLPRNIMP